MEDLLIVPCIAVAMALMYLVADLFGLAAGLGWRHYSKARKRKKLEQANRVETFK
jgi:hypothetical protein